MTGHSRSLKVFASIALVVMTCAGLASCGGSGGGSRPAVVTGGDEMVIMPRPPSQGAADLAVVSPAASNDTPVIGATFDLSTTVTNQGNSESVPTTLRYYRSADPMITAEDEPVGTEPVAPLDEVGSRTDSVLLTAPTNPGTYYYGACVDVVAGESNTTNNCSRAVEVTVLETASQQSGQPNLVVGTPTVSHANPPTGASFTLSLRSRHRAAARNRPR